MSEQDMNEFLNDWVSKTSMPITSDFPAAAIREGGRSFAAYLADKVDVKPAEPPKEGE